MITHGHSTASPDEEISAQEALREALDHARHYLPAQGPIGVFVHHNTLHAFQHMPFAEAVLKAAEIFRTEPYLSEEVYQQHRRDGRILDEDVDAVLAREADAEVLPGKLTRRELRRALLIPGVRRVNNGNVTWQIEEGLFTKQFRRDLPPTASRALSSDQPDRLWHVCTRRYLPTPPPAKAEPKRPRDAVLNSNLLDLDELINPIMIRLVSSYLDQGLAYWPMPLRETGLLGATRALFLSSRLAELPMNLTGLRAELAEQEAQKLSGEEALLRQLERLRVPKSEWEKVLTAELLSLPGWAGITHCLEVDPLLAPHERPSFSLMDFMAVRLTLTIVALQNVLGDAAAWKDRASPAPLHFDPLTHQARLFDAAQLLGFNSDILQGLPDRDFQALCHELELCNEVERRRLLHLAYERRHERQILIPLSRHHSLPGVVKRTDRLEAQVLFCIDEREESIRRALEEVEPTIETFGAAGFFGCAVDYTGLDDAGGVALCPVVVKPGHQVSETPVEDDTRQGHARQNARKLWARIWRNSGIASRTLVRGTLSTAFLGFLSLFPMALRVLSPLKYAKLMERLNRIFLPEPRTELTFMRNDDDSRNATTGLIQGFSFSEMADRVAGVLNPMGMTKGHARLVVILGHGSTSLNNPFVSAYCCGACGGRSGAPNARLFALMANKKEVRKLLAERGIHVPEDTWFLGGYHDTCNDDVELFDTDLMPASHQSDLGKLRQKLDEARMRSAHERTRRFAIFNNLRPVEEGLRHVQERAEHLAEPRPEYGHCTNAVAFVGRRTTTQGLFLDRRAFLVSYDANKDPQDKFLAAVLGAVIPVCGGINLEYYFSTVDNEGYGCGTKLPHNVTGLVGVMNGYQGDLRTGLPLQTVEIHEPVRILFIVETTPERLISVIHANPLLKEFLENEWIRMAIMDPVDGRIRIYRGNHQWEDLTGDEEPLPVAPTSLAYYCGKSGHLPIARIDPNLTTAA